MDLAVLPRTRCHHHGGRSCCCSGSHVFSVLLCSIACMQFASSVLTGTHACAGWKHIHFPIIFLHWGHTELDGAKPFP